MQTLRSYLTAPTFPDDEAKTRASRNLFVMLRVILLVALISIVSNIFMGLNIVAMGSLLLLMAVYLVVARQGYVYTSAVCFTLTLAALVIMSSAPRGGYQASSTAAG